LGIVASAKIGVGDMSQRFKFIEEVVPEERIIHRRVPFEIVTEGNLSLQYKICRNWWFRAGYTGTYFPKVALAGKQDRDLECIEESRFWIHGATAGFHICY
jgi:hypothetical protein